MNRPSRRRFLQTAAGLGLALAGWPFPPTPSAAARHRVYFGTYTRGASEGIYTAMFDTRKGSLTDVRLAAASENPSFLAISPDRRFLFAVNELGTYDGTPGGAVSAFTIDPSTGDLRFLNQQPSRGAHPCHIVTDRTGRWALVANYSGGNLAVLPIGADGRLEPPTTVVQHEGRSVNERRQEGPHAHSIHLDAGNRYAFAADLGIDRVMSYRWDARTGALTPNTPPGLATAPGAGPRHFAFHPSGRYAFVINELDSTLSALRYNAQAGELTMLDTVSTLPESFAGESTCADVRVSQNGRYVYGSNRGHDSIAAFAFDTRGERLTPIGHTPTGGATPRNFNLAPGGRFLLAANQNSDTVVTFRIGRRGRLSDPVHTADVPTPVCIDFL